MNFGGWRRGIGWAAIGVIAAVCGCTAPASGSKASQRDGVSFGQTLRPRGQSGQPTGVDERARDIERSLGMQ